MLYTAFPPFLMIFFAIPVAAFSLALAFYKINNQPFIKIVESALKYISSPRLYLWKKSKPKPGPVKTEIKKGTPPQIYIPKLTQNKLKDLAWSLDIKEKIK